MKVEDICDILNSENESDVNLGTGLFEVYKNESEILSIKEKTYVFDLLCSRFKNPKAKWNQLGWGTASYNKGDKYTLVRYFNGGPISGAFTTTTSSFPPFHYSKNYTIEL
jgi:hypothetical protein